MKICNDGRIWGQNNKEAGSHLGILATGQHIKKGTASESKKGNKNPMFGKKIDNSGSKNPHWKGGEYFINGYKLILLSPDDFFRSMADHKGYVMEHRLVMAKHLNRCLLPWEIVHHINSIKDDNRIENLQLISSQIYHFVDSKVKAYIKRLEAKIIKLEAQLSGK